MTQHITLSDARIQVCGLPWFGESAPRLYRFPQRMQGDLPEGIFAAGKQTAGVRLRCRTDTTTLGLLAEFPPFGVRTNMTQFTTHGVSTYVDGPCWSARIPKPEGGKVELELVEAGALQELRQPGLVQVDQLRSQALHLFDRGLDHFPNRAIGLLIANQLQEHSETSPVQRSLVQELGVAVGNLALGEPGALIGRIEPDGRIEHHHQIGNAARQGATEVSSMRERNDAVPA